MPTTRDEAEKIFTIINEYVGPKIAQELTARLDSEVGRVSDNDSLKESLTMLASLYNTDPPYSPKPSNSIAAEIKDCAGLHHDD